MSKTPSYWNKAKKYLSKKDKTMSFLIKKYKSPSETVPSLLDLFLLSMVGILGGLANLWLSQSYKYSEVSLVSPLKYLGLVFAIIFGYFIWNEIPTSKTLLGALLVIVSSIIIFRREMYLKKKLSVSRHE